MIKYFSRMKRIQLLLILSVLISLASPALAADIPEKMGPVRKLQRGFVNVALSPIEITTEMARVKKKDGVIPTWLTGAGRGAVYMVGRILAGTYDLVTFPLPLPAGYQPLIQPEFPWDHFSEDSAS